MSAYEWNQQVPLNQQQNSVDHTQEYNFYEDNNEYDASADHNNTSNVHEEQLITPKKGFEELLEEKLLEDVQKSGNNSNNNNNKPKRPFLRKGSGLERYNKSKTKIANVKTKKINKSVSNKNVTKKTTPGMYFI